MGVRVGDNHERLERPKYRARTVRYLYSKARLTHYARRSLLRPRKDQAARYPICAMFCRMRPRLDGVPEGPNPLLLISPVRLSTRTASNRCSNCNANSITSARGCEKMKGVLIRALLTIFMSLALSHSDMRAFTTFKFPLHETGKIYSRKATVVHQGSWFAHGLIGDLFNHNPDSSHPHLP